MSQFLSCDWGTSSFRLRLIEAETLDILAEQTSDRGIGPTFSLWQQSAQKDPAKRPAFYLSYVQENIDQIEERLPYSLAGIPLIFSGMASSSIGLRELPYGSMPFSTEGKDIPVVFLEPTAEFGYPCYLISGIKSKDDVMRGEETQLVGVASGLGEVDGEQLFIFPGTHSKHIWVRNRQAVDFKTYMTGEFFDLLSKKSILSASVEENKNTVSWDSFRRGVRTALNSNLLNASFTVRTQSLFGQLTKEESHDFFSGLLIGTELKALRQQELPRIYLCCSSHLKSRYEAALLELGMGKARVSSGEDIDRAVIRGQFQIYNQNQST